MATRGLAYQLLQKMMRQKKMMQNNNNTVSIREENQVSSQSTNSNNNNTIYDEYVFSTHHDLLDESGGRDLILLEMDGIIDYILSSNQQLLDWSEHGGQFLHVTFLLEKFMQQLLDRSILFKVVYFTKETQRIQVQGSKFSYLPVSHSQNILKKLILQHLIEKLHIPCECFDSWIRNPEPWENVCHFFSIFSFFVTYSVLVFGRKSSLIHHIFSTIHFV